MQKYSQIIALAALMISLNLSSATANTEKFCKEICKKFLTPEYTACKKTRRCSEKIEFRESNCKQRCSRENPSPKYDRCKKECLNRKTHPSNNSKKH